MAKLKLDLRKELRAVANAVQDENVARLLAGESVRGGPLANRRAPPVGPTKTRKRIRVLGERRKLSELAGHVGISSGDLLKDLGRRSNVKVGRVSFKIVPGANVILRARVFNRGDAKQVARPVMGMSREVMEAAAQSIADASRDQFVLSLKVT